MKTKSALCAGWITSVVLLAGMNFSLPASAQTWSVTSPNEQIQVTIKLAPPANDAAALPELSYRVEYGPEGNRTPVILDSPLGLKLQSQVSGKPQLTPVRESVVVKPIEDAYEMPHGKRRQCRNSAKQLTLRFDDAGQPVEIDFRAYNDGVAFRYRLPGSGGMQTLASEITGFALPKTARLWMHPSDKPTTYAPAYETYYENEITVGTPSPLGFGWAYPVLFRTEDSRHWGLITEANVGANFCGSRLSNTAPDGIYRISLPAPSEGNGTGSIHPASTLPWEMPWRVIILGDSLGTIVESTLVTDVSEPARIKNTDWVRPGRVAWSWWSDNPSPQDGAKQKKFVDLAAEMGWEYVLVDANWTIMDNGTIHDVLRYAKEKNVGVLLWYNSGGPHNVVTEKPRDCFTYREVRRFEFDMLRKWGVKGVKVDFFQSDKQNVIDLYHGIMQDAADYQIMVNFHGCTLPRGWSRTWPHLMSMEAVRGEECYIFDPKFPEQAPVQNTITPFTRNVVGPMDYTPVGFSDNRYPHKTTSAHELALSVIFESGWVHFADKAEAYLSLPAAPKEFLKKLPVAWDETRFVAGYPGKYLVLARRKGDTWYLAGINGQSEAFESTLKLGKWLGAGQFEITRIGDGSRARDFSTNIQSVSLGQEFLLFLAKMQPYGGFVATLKPAK